MDALLGDELGHPLQSVARDEVRDDALVARVDLSRQRVEPLLVAGHRDDAVVLARQSAGELAPDPALAPVPALCGGHQRAAGRVAGCKRNEMASNSGLRWVFWTAAIRHCPSLSRTTA
jgi:hypothetical protein